LQYLAEFPAFTLEIDYVRAYEIPAQITSIEWLNRDRNSPAKTFVVANDKKIRLFKLKKDFCEDFRRGAHSGPEEIEERDSSFVERFYQSNGQIIFPRTKAARELKEKTNQLLKVPSPFFERHGSP